MILALIGALISGALAYYIYRDLYNGLLGPRPFVRGPNSDALSRLTVADVIFERASLDDVEEIGEITAAAFSDNSLYNAVFQIENLDLKQRAMAWFFSRRAWVVLRCGNDFFVGRWRQHSGEKGRIVASVGLLYPQKRHTFMDMLMAGMLKWPFLWGFGSLKRLLEADKKLSKSLSDGDAYELAQVAVDPFVQGRGLGPALLNHTLKHIADHPEYGNRIVLSTQEEHAMRMYARAGFELLGRDTVTIGNSDPFLNIRMARGETHFKSR